MGSIGDVFKRIIDDLRISIGRMGYTNPPPNFSGILLNGKTYPVMMRNNGCYVYFDDNGNKIDLKTMVDGTYDFVNIVDARVDVQNACYRTSGGEVEVRIHYYMNNKNEILSTKVFVVNSEDVDIPIGTQYDKVPSSWVNIDCHTAEMIDRELVFVNKCFSTPGGKVNIQGIESLDPRLSMEISKYQVFQSTDTAFPEGLRIDVIPTGWVRMACDFPDMTHRDIIPILGCYDTVSGKIKIEGFQSVDPVLGVREEWYRIKESTDASNPVGKMLDFISDEWTQVVCDFTDMEDRDIEITTECYKTGSGNVKAEVKTSYDGNIGSRNTSYRILESSDPAILINSVMTSIPGSWVRSVCDFTDLEDRDVRITIECYSEIGGDKYKLECIRSYDGNIKVRSSSFRILESSDINNPAGKTMSSIPGGWHRVECGWVDRSDRLLDVEHSCYSTGKGTVKVMRRSSLDGYLDSSDDIYKVVDSSDTSVSIGYIPKASDIASWILVSCDIQDMTARHMISVRECYDTPNGKIFVEGTVLVDGLNRRGKNVNLFVSESTDPLYPLGSSIMSIPDGITRIPCLCKTC